jgi:hypothetical protein
MCMRTEEEGACSEEGSGSARPQLSLVEHRPAKILRERPLPSTLQHSLIRPPQYPANFHSDQPCQLERRSCAHQPPVIQWRSPLSLTQLTRIEARSGQSPHSVSRTSWALLCHLVLGKSHSSHSSLSPSHLTQKHVDGRVFRDHPGPPHPAGMYAVIHWRVWRVCSLVVGIARSNVQCRPCTYEPPYSCTDG